MRYVPFLFLGWGCAYTLAFSWIRSAAVASNTIRNRDQWTLKLGSDTDFFLNDPLYSLGRHTRRVEEISIIAYEDRGLRSRWGCDCLWGRHDQRQRRKSGSTYVHFS